MRNHLISKNLGVLWQGQLKIRIQKLLKRPMRDNWGLGGTQSHGAEFRIRWNLRGLQVRLISSLQEGKMRPEMGRALLREASQLAAHSSPSGTPGPQTTG